MGTCRLNKLRPDFQWLKKTLKLLFFKEQVIFLFFILLVGACTSTETKKKQKKEQLIPTVSVPDFSSDSAYAYIKKQLSFGPRVPNSQGHTACADFLVEKLNQYADTVLVQKAKAKAYDGTILNMKNIIAEFSPENPNRVLLFAHWDTRPIAEMCKNQDRQKEPIPGANDGASGVGVLLEIARHLKNTTPQIGIDIIFFDAEDYGEPKSDNIKSWCLGSQHWAKNPHKKNYYARYGILLDMVGGKHAKFTQEKFSVQFAADVVDKVWNTASVLGYSDYFIFKKTHFIGIDDHVPVSQIANIRSIDIVQYNPQTKGFANYWHTHNDDLSSIDKATLKAVGQTLLAVIFNEK